MQNIGFKGSPRGPVDLLFAEGQGFETRPGKQPKTFEKLSSTQAVNLDLWIMVYDCMHLSMNSNMDSTQAI